MFEGFKDFQKGAIIGRLHTAQMRVNSAQAEADSADVRARLNLESAKRAAARLLEAQEVISNLKDELARLERVAADALMDAAGRLAQVDAFMAQHPDSPLLMDSGKRFKKMGKIKTKSRLIYEAAHDARGRAMDIADPTQRRMD